jgi:hypothetical protein
MGLPKGRSKRMRQATKGSRLAATKGLQTMNLRTALAATLIAATTFPLAGLAQAAPLLRSEITKLFPGQFEAQVKGYRVNFTGSRNGSIVGVAYGQQDTGRWYMKGASLCVAFDKWTKGEAKCGRISQQGGWYVAHGNDGDVLKFRRTDLAQN